jgi:anti-sigma regulatory factor (Ser/Thr protein kinase)
MRVMPAGPEAAKEARDFLASVGCRTHHQEVIFEAQLLVSELVGNAVRHGLPPVEVAVFCRGADAMEVRVRDTGTRRGPAAIPDPEPPGEDAESGRGLMIVDLLSDAWGAVDEPDGTTVWFRLHVD